LGTNLEVLRFQHLCPTQLSLVYIKKGLVLVETKFVLHTLCAGGGEEQGGLDEEGWLWKWDASQNEASVGFA
jgi:hypothetical protein